MHMTMFKEPVEVNLEDVVGSLTPYAVGISGKEVTLIDEQASSYRDSYHTALILLPAKVLAPSLETGFLYYKIKTTLEAALLKHAEEPVSIQELPEKWRRRIRPGPGVHLQGFINEATMLPAMAKSFFSLFKVIEFGRLRQSLRHTCPALDEDIDRFMAESMMKKYLTVNYISFTSVQRTQLNNWAAYDASIKANPLLNDKKIASYEETELELSMKDLAYLLLFSQESAINTPLTAFTPRAQGLYQQIYPVISQPDISKSAVVRLTLDILEKDYFPLPAPKQRKNQEAAAQEMPPKPQEKKKPSRQEKSKPQDPLPDMLSAVVPLDYESVKRFDAYIVLKEKAAGSFIHVENQFRVDEWDQHQGQYIQDICVVRENDKFPVGQPGLDSRYVFNPEEVGAITEALRVLKPEGKVVTRRLQQGTFDFPAWEQYRREKKMGFNPEPRYFKRVERRQRDVAQLILWDISNSTQNYCSKAALDAKMRIIDMEKYGIEHYALAIRELGDDLAIFAYHSQGRDNISLYPLLHFGQEFTRESLNQKLTEVLPGFNNHDGAAIRYVLQKYLAPHAAQLRLLVHINDGVPADDVSSFRQRGKSAQLPAYEGEYAVADVKQALNECQQYDVTTFCLSFAEEKQRPLLEKIWGTEYKILRTPYSLGKKLAQIAREKTLI